MELFLYGQHKTCCCLIPLLGYFACHLAHQDDDILKVVQPYNVILTITTPQFLCD